MKKIRILAAAMVVAISIQIIVPIPAQATYQTRFFSNGVETVQQQSLDHSGAAGAVEDQSIEDKSKGNKAQTQSEPDGDGSALELASSAPVYQEGVILLYTYQQLCAVGSGQPVMTGDGTQQGSGEVVTDGQGQAVVYGLDAQYRLAQDIALPQGQLWQLPEGFSGRIAPAQLPQDGSVYDGETQTISIYNPYQLITMAQSDAADQPVLDGDWDAFRFGVGNLIYPQGETGAFLTYDPANRYIISASFCSDMPESSTVAPLAEGTDAWGRDFPGQVIKEIDGETYILIGNADQLRAIGSGDRVYTAVYQAKLNGLHWEVNTDSSGNPIMLYGGDADLLQSQNGNKDYTFGSIEAASGALTGRCGVNQSTGEIDPDMKIEDSGATYSSTANYIIFRDIDLGNEPWTPLMFSGTMTGAVAENGGKLWNEEATEITVTKRPVISNVQVIQNTPLDVGERMGVGFFATLYSETGEIGDSFGSTGTTEVSNLVLESVTVETTTTETKYEQTLLNGLLSGLGWILGGALDGILGLLGIHVGLQEVLTGLLDARKTDPTALATGAFAGRVVGDVRITNCDVVTPSIVNVNGATGGFIGYSEGVTSYATEGIGQIVELLSNILNGIPGLGLGDLITILLDNGLTVGNLIPTGYTAPQITNCQVVGLSGTLGNDSNPYVGGFIGLQVGTKVADCTVRGDQYVVLSSAYGGGFAGLARDAEIKGLLSNLGVELFRLFLPQSLLVNCEVAASSVTVTGGDYQGGFVGALANSYAVNDTLTATVAVTGSQSTQPAAQGSSIGGFAGIATTGWVTNLGAGEDTNNGLLDNVGDLLTDLLSQNPGQAQMLLSLAGVAPSAIMGCQINPGGNTAGNRVTVSGNDYVGGMLGKGDGVYLTPSTPENIARLNSLEELLTGQQVVARDSSLDGLSTVTAGGDYAGGVAGSLGAASVGGLLNNTLGVASFLGFTVSDFQLSGPTTGLTVTADRYAGGAFGETVGGDASHVSVSNLGNVTAGNYAAGFVGVCGPGDLASTGGLTLNLLGLNNLLKVDSLLSVIPGVKVELADCSVTGTDVGYTVAATDADTTVVQNYVAGGFAAHCNSTKLSNCHADKLASVTAADQQGYAGGFVGISRTGGLADLANEDGELQVGGSLISVENLLGTIDYMIPTYTDCTVTYVDGGSVQADVAGGFAADFQSGKVDNRSRGEGNYYAVYNIGSVNGQTYAGGFGGKVYSGALADAGGGISILGGSGLSINLSQLLDVIEAYVPYVEYAGVRSDDGFTVTANKLADQDSYSGSAGGFIGYASGAQISTCDVTYLKHTTVTPPEKLEGMDAPSYFDQVQSVYAVTGGRYAGGFVGCMDIGSAASVGSGLGVLGQSIALTDLLSALDVVVTTIEHSEVNGAVGGYSVLASQTDDSGALGHAGGYAGAIYGGHIQDSNAHNFEYIIGQISAGGYVGEMEPGNVANVLGDGSILNKLVNLDDLASGLQVFVPTIRNSSTDTVPCGGAVRAQAFSDAAVQRGMAGGYVGHNVGGSIWGLNTDPWKTALDPYDGPTSLCKAERIRSVYGAEYAGGYTGLMEAADTASAGGLSLLGGLIEVGNLLSVLSVVYPTQENTAVYGPLANLDVDTWNRWVVYVGQYGGYGYELARAGTVNSQEELNAKLEQYIYGYHVVAGRSQEEALLPDPGGDAGGYVGLMRSGTLTNCMAYDVKLVQGWHAAGGYAGSMETGGAADFGSVSILGLDLNVGQLVQVAQLFVPAVKNSSVYGYTSGLTVQATGLPSDGAGYAGGYVGCSYGAQIQLDDKKLPNTGDEGSVTWTGTTKYPAPTASCDVGNLRRVTGRNAIGGYVGVASAASLASVDTNASEGLLQGILNAVIANAADLVDVLPATYTTIHKARVSPADEAWGFVVDGAYTTDGTRVEYAPFAGGFAGYVQAAALGEKDTADALTVTGLRSVDGGLYAGGFLGLADSAGVAQVGDSTESGGTVDVIGSILQLGDVNALDVLRCYIYQAGVTGVAEGYTVQAHSETNEGILDETRTTGCAGGFAGGLMNGTIQNSAAANLSTVRGLNYTGGFVGHMGKSGAVDVDSVEVLSKLLSATAGAIELFGSQVFDSSVTGIAQGAVIQATDGQEPIAGGFSGYSDLGRIRNATVTNLKKVTSDQIAGGFTGQTDMAYLVSVGAESPLVQAVLRIVNELVKALYLDEHGLAEINLVDLNLGILKVELLSDGNTLKVELLGLPITVALSKAAENGQQTDVAIVTIGDSVIRLPCNEDGLTSEGEHELENAEINLIKGNRTELEGCTVTGIDNGYDVFGGGATQDADGTHANGMAGGFVGYNHEGKISNSQMVLCDVVRGTAEKVGPFTGYNDLKSVYWFNDIASIEAENNRYSIYRPSDTGLTAIQAGGQQIDATATQETVGGTAYNRYLIQHIKSLEGVINTGKEMTVYDTFLALEGALETGGGGAQRELNAYVSPAKAVLMLDAASPDNPPTTVPEPGENADPCSETVDLTLQKIWKDWLNLGGTRPDSITINVYFQKFDPNGTSLGERSLYQAVTLTKENQESAWSAVWSTVLENAPLYEYEDANANGIRDENEPITAYYVYTVEEANVPAGYTASYETYDPSHAGGYELTITNTLSIKLPDTGGVGSAWFVVVGVGILLPALTVRKRRRKRRED